MNAVEFEKGYAKRYGVSYKQAKKDCENVFDYLSECLDEIEIGDRVYFYGFGTFIKKMRPSRNGADPNTKEPIVIPEKTVYVFKKAAGNFLPARKLREEKMKKEAELMDF